MDLSTIQRDGLEYWIWSLDETDLAMAVNFKKLLESIGDKLEFKRKMNEYLLSMDEIDLDNFIYDLEEVLEKHKMATLTKKGGATAAAAPALSPLQKKLRAMKESWNSSKEEGKKTTTGGTTLTDGRHLCKLTDASLNEGSKGPFVKLEFTCVEGEETGEKGVRICGLDNEERLVYLQRDLTRLGVDIDELDIEQLPDLLGELAAQAPGVRVTVKTNEGSDGKMYQNCYIDKLVELNGQAEEAEAEAPAEEAAAETEEAPAEEAAAEEEGETLEVGDDVSYLSGKVKLTGVVKSIDYDTSMIGIRDDKTKKVVSVHAEKVDKLVTEA